MKGIYLANCEDWLNLDHVRMIEFRDKSGNIPARQEVPSGIVKARVWFVGQHREDYTLYLGQTAQELYRLVRGEP